MGQDVFNSNKIYFTDMFCSNYIISKIWKKVGKNNSKKFLKKESQ